ncbi:hypothetical protein F2Q69_00057696 [Brassica cretica]|uniref:RNase H type-1 domain-containing protein n=1 Tax=Brassica cretica TaxID=69181 RepID=A0A8S9N076_BRACR|nr:hypothetical protein F2Q69_00057696 [Brassica cretica]
MVQHITKCCMYSQMKISYTALLMRRGIVRPLQVALDECGTLTLALPFIRVFFLADLALALKAAVTDAVNAGVEDLVCFSDSKSLVTVLTGKARLSLSPLNFSA